MSIVIPFHGILLRFDPDQHSNQPKLLLFIPSQPLPGIRTTEYEYDFAGRLSTQIAHNPKGSGNGVEQQKTRYLYESSLMGSFNTAVAYPDTADTMTQDSITKVWTITSGNDHVASTHDRLGRVLTSTDQRGVVQEYSFDAAGRLIADAVTSLGSSGIVDDNVLRIERSYTDLGRLATITSYDAASGGDIVNQVAYDYDGWGNVIASAQAHSGAVDEYTPTVQYVYDDGAADGEARFVRLVTMIYPDGREVFYNYASSGVGAALSRLDNIAADSSSTEIFESYRYLGSGTIIGVSRPAIDGGLNLSYGAAGVYDGLDRFGRVALHEWRRDDTTLVDGYAYTYDRAGSRTAKFNLMNSDYNEIYDYDALNRLIQAQRDGDAFQSWELDALGNWSGFDDQGDGQTRDHNAANETTAISGAWIAPTYDAAGNMTSGPRPGDEETRLHFTYNAWNQLVKVHSDDDGQSDELIATYVYDGQGRRIAKAVDSDTFNYFWSEGYQNIEIRLNGDADPYEQWIYSVRYVDAPIIRFRDADTDGTVDSTHHVLQDANFNVTSIVNLDGDVDERYVFTPYGERMILTDAWADRANSSFEWIVGHQGLAYDVETGLVYNRARYLHTSMGTFTVRDPLGYVDGGNLYQNVVGRPLDRLDASGLDTRNYRLTGEVWSEAKNEAFDRRFPDAKVRWNQNQLQNFMHLDPEFRASASKIFVKKVEWYWKERGIKVIDRDPVVALNISPFNEHQVSGMKYYNRPVVGHGNDGATRIDPKTITYEVTKQRTNGIWCLSAEIGGTFVIILDYKKIELKPDKDWIYGHEQAHVMFLIAAYTETAKSMTIDIETFNNTQERDEQVAEAERKRIYNAYAETLGGWVNADERHDTEVVVGGRSPPKHGRPVAPIGKMPTNRPPREAWDAPF